MIATPSNFGPFDPKPIRRCLRELTGKDPDSTYFRTIRPKAGANGSRKGADLLGFDPAALLADNRAGQNIYMVVGRATGASGINKRGEPTGAVIDQDVTDCPCLFVEWDDRPKVEQLRAWKELGLPEPTVMIDSGGKSLHCYWRMAEPITPAQWTEATARLIAHCGSDRNCSNVSRLMRVPGFAYIDKKTGKPTGAAAEVVYESGRRYSLQEVMDCIPAPQSVVEDEPAPPAPQRPRLRLVGVFPPRSFEEVNAAAEFIPKRVDGEGTYESDRNALCGCSAALADAGCANPDAAALALLGGKWPSRKDAEHVLATTTTRKADSFWAIARANGYDLRRHDLSGKDDDQSGFIDKRKGDINAQPEPEPYQVLGWCTDRRKVWYRHRQTAQIASAVPYGQAELLRLAPLAHWWDTYPIKNDDGKVIRCNWAQAADDIARAADRVGVFEPDQVRGRGVWIDDGRTVWHLGDRLEVDGQEMALTDLQSRNQYGLMPALPINPHVAPLDDEHGRQILQVIKDRGWQGPSDHLHLAGYAVLSNVGGALKYRPALQVTGNFGGGKSDTIDNKIQPLQAGIGRISTGSTEAGIRQLIGRDALPCTVDESEAEDGRKREAQLRLVRYSFDGKEQVKGTPNGEPMKFCLRSSLCLAGINAPIDNPADRSRIAVITPQHLPADQWAEVGKRRAALITPEIGQRLIRRTVSNLPALLANIATMGRVISGQIASNEGGRAGDTFGALLAGAHHLTSTAEITDDEALAWLDSVGWDITHADTDDTDRKAGAEGRQCLEYLLAHEVRWQPAYDPDAGRPSTGSLTVRELVRLAHNSPRSGDGQVARSALGRKGIHATPEGLAVARSSPATHAIFSPTKWAKGGHASRLLEIEGTTRINGTMRFPDGGSHRAVIVPWAAVGALGEQ